MSEDKRRVSSILVLLIAMTLLPISGLTPVLAQAPPRDKTLMVDMVGRTVDPENYNPFMVGTPRSNGLHALCTEYFFYYNLTDGTLLPWLATGYSYEENYKKLVVTLREGVKWSDGKPFTADDVVFTYEMLLENVPRLQHSSEVADIVEKVAKTDDYTVEISLKRTNPRFHYTWAFPTITLWGGLPIVPEHVWQGVDPLTFKNNPPIFTGPFELVTASETSCLWRRRDDWWGTEVFGIRPAFEYALYVFYGPEEMSAMKMSIHELDTIHDFLPSTFWDLKEKNPYVGTWSDEPPYAYVSALCDRYLSLNNLKYPWNNKKVRWAVSYLLSKDEIIKIGWEGTSRPLRGPLAETGVLIPWIERPEIIDLMSKYDATEYNPDKAYAIFEELEFTRGADGIWVTPNGTRLEFVMEIPTWEIAGKKAEIVMAEQLKEGGIDASVRVLEGGPWDDSGTSGQFDATYVWHCPAGGAYEPYTYLDHWHSKWSAPIGESAVDNWCRFMNSTFDELLDTMEVLPETDPKYIEAYIKATEIWLDNLPELPIALSRKMIPYDTYYWVNWPTAKNPWWSPQTWHAYLPLYLGLRPREIEYEVAYFTRDTPKFRGVDHISYGPFKSGDSASIPVGDADYQIRMGRASYTPVIPTPEFPELEVIAETVSALSTSVDELKTGQEAIRSDVAGVSSTVTSLAAGIVVEAIVIIVLAVALLRRSPRD